MQLIDAHQKDDHRPLGFIMLNVPQMRDALDVDLMALRHIEMQRDHVYYERSQLNPDVFPPKQKNRNMSAIMVDTNAVA